MMHCLRMSIGRWQKGNRAWGQEQYSNMEIWGGLLQNIA
jgi:hypothetical protein